MQSSHEISRFYINTRSIQNKKNLLFTHMAAEELDIVIITESWAQTASIDFLDECKIQEYKILNKDRAVREGGAF